MKVLLNTALFRDIADITPALLWVTDGDDQCVFVNASWEVFTGQPVETALGAGWFTMVHPDDLACVEKAFLATTANRQPLNLEYRLKSASGEYRWVMDKGQPHYDEKGMYKGYIGSVMDIHEKKMSEAALVESRERYQDLFNSIDAGFCAFDMKYDENGVPVDYLFVEANPAFERHTGIHNAVGRWMRDIAPAHEQYWFDIYGKVALTGEPLRFQNSAAALGRSFDLYAFRIGKPEQRRVGVLFNDTTERDRVEHDLRQSEAFSRNLMQASADCIKILDLEGNIQQINQAGCRILQTENPVGTNWFGYWPDTVRAEIEQNFARAIRGEGQRFHSYTDQLQGETRWWEIQVAPVFDEGKIVNVLSISRDITIEKKSESLLQQAADNAEAASRAKSEFLANMSHEIRTPMGVVIGLANILSKTQPLTGQQREYLRTLQTSSATLLALINDLLDFSRIEAGNLELEETAFNLVDLVEGLADMKRFKAEEKQLVFRTQYENVASKEYMGDPTRVRQIVLNLCSNAIKFTDKGSVTLSMRAAPMAANGTEMIEISVSDTGIGIAPENMGSIFEKFTQADTTIVRRYGGTGLGLAITKNLIEMMGGKIAVTSTPGEGSNFTVTFPLRRRFTDEMAMPDMVREDGAQAPLRSDARRILLVEDYYPNALVAGTFLNEFGYDYDRAESGHEAVEKFMNCAPYEAVLMDVQMPGMDGYEATRAIRDHEMVKGLPRTRIIGLTAHASPEDRARCLAAGMDDYLPKPFEQKRLGEKLRG